MATFKPEEIQAIEDGGNAVSEKFCGAFTRSRSLLNLPGADPLPFLPSFQVAMGTFLARWSPDDLPKPTDRSPSKIRDWIEAVFVRKRFYAEPQFRSLDGGGGGGSGGASASASGRPASSHPASPSLASPERGHLAAPAVATVPAAPRADSGGLISLDDGGGAGAAAASAPAWDAFGDAAPEPAAAPVDGWAAFGAPETAAAPASPDAPAGWASFDAPTPAPAPPASLPRAAAAAGTATATPSPSSVPAPGGWAAFDTPAAAAPPSSAGTTPSSRAQLPSDLFSAAAARPASASTSAPPSLPPSSTGGSPAQPSMTTATAAVTDMPPSDPFSTLVPGLRGALPAVVGNGHGPAAAVASPSGGWTTTPKSSGNPFA